LVKAFGVLSVIAPDPSDRGKEGTHMLLMVVGLLIFFLIHLVPTSPDLRRGLVERFGENAYKLVFSLVSLVGFALIIYGYGKLHLTPGKNPVLWTPPHGLRHLTMLLMWPAFILLVAAYVPSRIRTAMKHPMLVAVKLWALSHLLIRGDLASIVLFGSFLAWAVYDRISVKRRFAMGPLGGREGGLGGDIAVVVIGTALYAAMLLWGHPRLIGVPLVPGWV
jgi:uncharacterized membrane protein